MKRLAFLTLGAVMMGAMNGCGGGEPQDPVIGASADDPRLVAAVEEARDRWGEFESAFSQREPNVAYAVKLGLPTASGSVEYVWMQVTSIENGVVSGTLDNHPAEDVGYERGDVLTVRADEIQDWLIGRGPTDLTGGFSINALEQIKREGP